MKCPFRWLIIALILGMPCLKIFAQEQKPDLDSFDRDTLVLLCEQLYQRIEMVKQQAGKVQQDMDVV